MEIKPLFKFNQEWKQEKMPRELNAKQQMFLDVLFEEANGDMVTAKKLAGYAEATNTKPNGWWVINKGTGEFKHVDSPNLNTKDVLQKTKQLHKELQENKFRRCFEDEPETYRKKPSGNRKLGKECSWCAYRHACWPGLKEMPSKVSQAENPPMVCYTEVR